MGHARQRSRAKWKHILRQYNFDMLAQSQSRAKTYGVNRIHCDSPPLSPLHERHHFAARTRGNHGVGLSTGSS